MSVGKQVANFFFLPIRVILKPEKVRRFGLTPIVDERHDIVLKHLKGNLLDIGCGPNLLVKKYGKGIGVDVYPWDGIDVLVHTPFLPFSSKIFDNITFMACLNHIPQNIRLKVLQDAKRVLKDDGQIIITMITPKISYIGHNYLFGWRDPDIQDRGMKEGEEWGLTPKQIQSQLAEGGLKLVTHKKFLYGLNHFYIFHKD